MIDSLCGVLESDYIVFPVLKQKNVSWYHGYKGFGASLEVAIASKAKHDITWAGTGEFKRGSIVCAGGTQNKKAAEELILLVRLSSLHSRPLPIGGFYCLGCQPDRHNC